MRDDPPRVAPIPDPLVEVDWAYGVGACGVIVRPGTGRHRGLARAGRFGTEVYWSTEGREGGVHTSFRIMYGDAASPDAAALRGLAMLSVHGHWSPDLRDYVLALAREARA